MPSTRLRRLLACLALALTLGLLPAAAGAVDLFGRSGSAGREEPAAMAPAAPEGWLWSAVWGMLERLGLVETPTTSQPPSGTTQTTAADDDQGVTLDPNG